jgi:hypothetical protein
MLSRGYFSYLQCNGWGTFSLCRGVLSHFCSILDQTKQFLGGNVVLFLYIPRFFRQAYPTPKSATAPGS